MRGAVMYALGGVRIERRDEPEIIKPTDAVMRLAPAACDARRLDAGTTPAYGRRNCIPSCDVLIP